MILSVKYRLRHSIKDRFVRVKTDRTTPERIKQLTAETLNESEDSLEIIEWHAVTASDAVYQ